MRSGCRRPDRRSRPLVLPSRSSPCPVSLPFMHVAQRKLGANRTLLVVLQCFGRACAIPAGNRSLTPCDHARPSPRMRAGIRLSLGSLMGLGWIALEPIDQAGLCRAQRQPITSRLLQRNEELPAAVHRLLVQFVGALELGFECKLAAHRAVSAALAPNGDVRFGGDPPAEVQLTEVLKDLLDD